MMNYLVMIGRILEIKKQSMVLAVQSNHKNEKGKYETYKNEVFLFGKLYESLFEYCTKGDLVGIKGHVENNGKIIAEKVSFLSSRKQED